MWVFSNDVLLRIFSAHQKGTLLGIISIGSSALETLLKIHKHHAAESWPVLKSSEIAQISVSIAIGWIKQSL